MYISWSLANKFCRTLSSPHKETTSQVMGHIGQQNMKVEVKANFGRLATACLIQADISS